MMIAMTMHKHMCPHSKMTKFIENYRRPQLFESLSRPLEGKVLIPEAGHDKIQPASLHKMLTFHHFTKFRCFFGMNFPKSCTI